MFCKYKNFITFAPAEHTYSITGDKSRDFCPCEPFGTVSYIYPVYMYVLQHTDFFY